MHGKLINRKHIKKNISKINNKNIMP